MNKTYNNIIDSLKLVGDKHLMIKKVESGDLWDMDLEKKALDVITLIREQSYEGLYTQDDFNIEPFTERFDNALAGWTFNLPVEVENDYQTCNIPTL